MELRIAELTSADRQGFGSGQPLKADAYINDEDQLDLAPTERTADVTSHHGASMALLPSSNLRNRRSCPEPESRRLRRIGTYWSPETLPCRGRRRRPYIGW